MQNDVTVRWLGVSGVEITMGEQRILIDPVFSRVPLGRTLFGRIEPDADAVRRQASGCLGIFVTHAHHDHLMDAPLLSNLTGSPIYASGNACRVAMACGADEGLLHAVGRGAAVQVGSFVVTALPSEHIRLPGFGYGAPQPGLHPPLRARQYRMDESFVFLVQAGQWRLLAGPGLCLADPGRVDALLCCPLYLGGKLGEYVGGLHPRVFLPIHWDDMFRADDGRPVPGRQPRIPPRRLDMRRVAQRTEELGVKYVQPEIRRNYSLAGLVR